MTRTHKKHQPISQQPRVRNLSAVAAWQRNSAGPHGKTHKQQRPNEKARIRKEYM